MKLLNTLFLWIVAGIVVYRAIMVLAKRKPEREDEKKNMEKPKWLLILEILGLAIGIFISRIIGFGSLPSFIGVDEAGIAYDAYCMVMQGTDRYLNTFPVYMINFGGGQSALYTYLAALCIRIFGFSITAVRLPSLLFYLASIGLMFAIVYKGENKKIAWLVAFLIVICPWHIIQSRYALDCNLLAPMLLAIIAGILTSKKWWQYALVGVLIGITLYTYSLSWMILPACLFVWFIYLLYTKKIRVSHIVAMGMPAFLLAIPLFCFIAVNKGIVPETNLHFGIFTIPKLYEFRSGEIGFGNLRNIGENLYKMFYKGPLDATFCFYYAEWLLAFVGIMKVVWSFIKNRKQRNFVFAHFMLLTVLAIFACLLLVEDMNTTKANAFYIPMLYFAAIGIQVVAGNKKSIFICIILLHIIAFGAFEWYYYTKYDEDGQNPYNDTYLYSISKEMEEKFPDKKIYIVTVNVSQTYIYTMIANQISPKEFDETKVATYTPLAVEGNYYVGVKQVGRYYFIEGRNPEKNIEVEEDAVYIVQKYGAKLLQILQEKIGLKEQYGQEYYVFYK